MSDEGLAYDIYAFLIAGILLVMKRKSEIYD